MDFTREPIIETVITPREGCKLVVRSSKHSGQEEYFVDALEVVSFGNSFFFRCLEKPKPFIVPTSDYEVVEVREARMVLKTVSQGKIKIAGGRESPSPKPKESATTEESKEGQSRADKRRERRRSMRKRGRRGPDESFSDDDSQDSSSQENTSERTPERSHDRPERTAERSERSQERSDLPPREVLASLLPPPPTLISETIKRYKEDESFKGAFFEGREQVVERETVVPISDDE